MYAHRSGKKVLCIYLVCIYLGSTVSFSDRIIGMVSIRRTECQIDRPNCSVLRVFLFNKAGPNPGIRFDDIFRLFDPFFHRKPFQLTATLRLHLALSYAQRKRISITVQYSKQYLAGHVKTELLQETSTLALISVIRKTSRKLALNRAT